MRSLSYYQIWIAALEKLLAERKLAAAGRAGRPAARCTRPCRWRACCRPPTCPRRWPRARPPSARPRRPRVSRSATECAHAAHRVDHHTRLPGYAHGRHGVIESVQGAHVFADSHAQGLGEQPQWLYRVAFSGTELWGADAAPGTSVALDAWESYLEPAA